MAARYRVGSDGLRVTTARGVYSLPPGALLDEIPHQYEGSLEVVEWEILDDEPKRQRGYEDKAIRASQYEDK